MVGVRLRGPVVVGVTVRGPVVGVAARNPAVGVAV